MSDVFEEYAKIAVAQGLVKEAGLEKKAEEETNPRYDSLDLDAIEMLYGVKPNGKEDEKHIVEQAHPEPAVVSPAYDRVNGLVENGLERQDVMHYIATKPNHGKHIQERYVKAHQDLVNEVIKAAFILDRDDEHELMVFADNCAECLTKSAGVFVPIAIGVAALLSAAGLINNFGGEIDKGVIINADRAIEELQEMKDNLPKLSPMINSLVEDISFVKRLNHDLTDYNVDLGSGDLKTDTDVGKQLLGKYIKASRSLSSRIKKMLTIIKSTPEKASWLTDTLGDTGSFIEEWLVEPIAGSDIRDVVLILETLDESLQASVSNMRNLFGTVKRSVKSGDVESLENLLGQELPEEMISQKKEPELPKGEAPAV
jgi:hypothetical protein